MTPEEANAHLEACRGEIDDLDRQIVALLNARAGVAARIGDIKQEAAMRVYEPKREDQVYQNVVATNPGPLKGDALRRIYERIMDEMRSLQRDRMAGRQEAGLDRRNG
ncbi:MAG: chorismate mutase [Acidobacteria bacterium]|nr:chorismate mutase [Acidobacteriota bacterium]